MEKFNNTSIFTGYLKQFLHNYNLPKYKIYTKEQRKYFEENRKERNDVFKTTILDKTSTNQTLIHYVPYIKDGLIQEYINGEWINVGLRNINNKHLHHYEENIKILNYTKNLEIKNNIYDSYTHEYLGDYLRFKRDFNGLDLMPLYNCFSNRSCNNLNFSWVSYKDLDKNGKQQAHYINFNSADTNYKIYMLPVKLFKEYTIAIDSAVPIEMCCGLYGDYQDTREIFKDIPEKTYFKVRQAYFGQPFLYSNILNLINAKKNEQENEKFRNELAQNEDKLKLFIKIPVNNTSTITVLEGNYTKWTSFNSDCNVAKLAINNRPASFKNYTIINFEYLKEDMELELKTPLQLLRFNTGESYPFADRLIEYLTENAITLTDTIGQNIARVQKVIKKETASYNNYDKNGNEIFTYKYEPESIGFWEPPLKYIIYTYMNTKRNTFTENHDILGYVDKDVESYYYYTEKIGNKVEKVSMAEVTVDSEGK